MATTDGKNDICELKIADDPIMDDTINISDQTSNSIFEIKDSTKNISESEASASDSMLVAALNAGDSVLVAALDGECLPARSSNRLDVPVKNTELRVLSWNIDGRDERELEVRTLTVAEYIATLSPHIVFLQEVVPENLRILLTNLCQKYDIIHRKIDWYYIVMMIKKDSNIRINSWKCDDFSNSRMGRCLLYVEAEIFNTPFVLLTSHLESLKDFSKARKQQLVECFDVVNTYVTKHNVIFSGDLNLRDEELKGIGGIPEFLFDAWEVCGCNNKTKYTWDMKLNNNLSFPSFKPSSRFDRMYYSSLGNNGIICSDFQLVGKKRIDACALFPSDHFGIIATYSIALRNSHIT